MSSITSSLNVNVNAETKKEASKVLDELGLNMTTAINIYLKQIVKHNGIPFEVKNRVPNHKLKKALKETDKIIKGKVNSKAYSSAEDLMKDIIDYENGTYKVVSTKSFNKAIKKVYKQGKDLTKLNTLINKLINCETLDLRYKNHLLINDRYYKDCYECHIEPDWLLIYKYDNNKLILILVETGSHSNLFRKF